MENQKKRKKWLKHEEKEFLRLIHLQKTFPNWEKISKNLKTLKIIKTADQCYFRWFNNKSKKPEYILKFHKKTKFTKAEEKNLLKLSYTYAPKWKKISYYFEGRNRFDVTNHFYGIIKKTLYKACKILKFKKAGDVISKIKPRLYSCLINKEIEIDFREFKFKEKNFKNFGNEKCNENCNENCNEIYFFTFFEFVCSIYFYDFEDIWEKITEKEIFILKKVLIYIIEMNFTYNRVVKMTQRKIEDFSKIKDNLQNFQKKIISSLNTSFYEENKNIIELPEETLKREKEIKILKEKDKLRREKDKLIMLEQEGKKNNTKNYLFFKNKILKSGITQKKQNEFFVIQYNNLKIQDKKNIYNNNIQIFQKFNPKIEKKIFIRKNIDNNFIFIKKKKNIYKKCENFFFIYKTKRKSSIVTNYFSGGFNISYYGNKKKSSENFKRYFFRNEFNWSQ